MRRYFSIIVGEDCNARCRFCIASDTIKRAAEPFPLDRALAAAEWAAAHGATVASVSGGGEPLMLAAQHPDLFNRLTDGLAGLFPKRDLHSNYAVPVGIRRTRLYPGYTDLTASLWPTADINRAYLRTHTFDRTVTTLRHEHTTGAPRRLRLSATLGTDWMRSLTDLYDYVAFAKTLGAGAITLRPLVTGPAATAEQAAWIAERRLDGAVVTGWLHNAGVPVRATTVRDADVFDLDGIAVCVYRYAIEDNQPDEDFWYFRPATTTGLYGLFTDYHADLPAPVSIEDTTAA